MEHYKFTQAVIIAGKTFGLGIQQVPAEIEQHPHFLRYAECGWIHEVDPSELVPAKKELSRKIDLAEKLRAKKKTEHHQEPVLETTGGVVPADGDLKVTKLQPIVGAEQVPEGVQVDHVSIDPADDELNDTVDDVDLTPQQKAARTRARNAAAKQKEQ